MAQSRSSRGTFAGTFARKTSIRGTSIRGTFSSRTSSKFLEDISKEAAQFQFQRTELEDQVEEQVFSGAGMGNMKVLFAVKIQLYTLVEEDAKKKKKKLKDKGKEHLKKEEKILVLARDWCGAFALFMIESAGKLFGKKYKFSSSLPLVEGFNIDDKKIAKDTAKFILVVDDNPLRLETNVKGKLTIEKGLKMAFDSMYAMDSPKEDHMLMRLASVDFAKSVGELPEPDPKVVDALVRTCLERGGDDKKALSDMRRMLYTEKARDTSIMTILQFVEKGANTSQQMRYALDCLEQAFKSPCSSQPNVYEKAFEALSTVREAKSVHGEDIANQADDLIEDFRVLDELLAGWEGRAFLPEVPFTREFYHPSDSRYAKKAEKKKDQKPTFKNLWGSGFYLAISLKNHEGQYASDGKGNIPAIQLPNIPSKRDMNEHDADFKWLMSLGGNWFDMLSRATSMSEMNPFRQALIDGFKQLSQTTGITDLGLIFDRPIYIESTDTSVICCGKVYDRPPPFTLKEPHYIFEEGRSFEHVFYERYYGIEPTVLLESLPHTKYGQRWVHAATEHSVNLTEPLPPGVYLCLARMVSMMNGFHVLVRDECRAMLPTVFVSQTHLTEEDKDFLIEGRMMMDNGNPIMSDEFAIDFSVPDEESTFQQRLHRAMFELSAELLLENPNELGSLFDGECITIDERDGVEVIVIGSLTNVMDLRKEWENRLVWMPLEQFEVFNYSLYCQQLYPLFLENYLIAKHRFATSMPVGDTADEIFRYNVLEDSPERNALFKMLETEKQWIPMQWIRRVLRWLCTGGGSLSDEVDKEGRTTQAIVKEAKKRVFLPHERARKLIIEDVLEGRRPMWSSVEKKLSVLERHEDAAFHGRTDDLDDTVDASILGLDDENHARGAADAYRVEFSLEELANVDEEYVMSSWDICEIITQEIIDRSVVEASTGFELREIQSTIDGIIDFMEREEEAKFNDMFNEAMQTASRTLSMKRIDRAKELMELYEGMPHRLRDLPQHQLDVEKSRVSYQPHVSLLVAEFDSMVSRVESLTHVIEKCLDISELVTMVDDLNKSAKSHAETILRPLRSPTKGSTGGKKIKRKKDSLSTSRRSGRKRIGGHSGEGDYEGGEGGALTSSSPSTSSMSMSGTPDSLRKSRHRSSSLLSSSSSSLATTPRPSSATFLRKSGGRLASVSRSITSQRRDQPSPTMTSPSQSQTQHLPSHASSSKRRSTPQSARNVIVRLDDMLRDAMKGTLSSDEENALPQRKSVIETTLEMEEEKKMMMKKTSKKRSSSTPRNRRPPPPPSSPAVLPADASTAERAMFNKKKQIQTLRHEQLRQIRDHYGRVSPSSKISHTTFHSPMYQPRRSMSPRKRTGVAVSPSPILRKGAFSSPMAVAVLMGEKGARLEHRTSTRRQDVDGDGEDSDMVMEGYDSDFSSGAGVRTVQGEEKEESAQKSKGRRKDEFGDELTNDVVKVGDTLQSPKKVRSSPKKVVGSPTPRQTFEKKSAKSKRKMDSKQGRTITLMSSDRRKFPVPLDNAVKYSDSLRRVPRQALISHVIDGIFMDASSSVLEIVSRFLHNPGVIHMPPSDWLSEDVDLEELVSISKELAIPTLFICSMTLAYTAPTVNEKSLLNAIEGSFLMQHTVESWHEWDMRAMGAWSAAFDVMWYLRCEEVQIDVPYETHRKRWKQIYAETRIETLLRAGVQYVDEREMDLWHGIIGPYVTHCDLSNARVRDADVALLAMCAPHLVDVDLRGTSLTETSLESLLSCCKQLRTVWLDEGVIPDETLMEFQKYHSSVSFNIEKLRPRSFKASTTPSRLSSSTDDA
eukprot:TRINITY_DN207_c0_g1_i1.p1 TRINITY_DN207_c0_g1~~TRINITY_DN207_c0_g1_i1.p1  ORF type:complete len:2092 (+),score=653.69 TRINITY_DN207_c0_g1_i1:828-6278(+)